MQDDLRDESREALNKFFAKNVKQGDTMADVANIEGFFIGGFGKPKKETQGECCMPAELLPIEYDKLGGERIDNRPEKVYTITRRPPPTSKKSYPPDLKYLGSWNKTRRPHDIGQQHKKNKAAKKSRKINRNK